MKTITKIIGLLLVSSLMAEAQETAPKVKLVVSSCLKGAEGPSWSPEGFLLISNAHSNWIARLRGNSLDTFAVSDGKNFLQTNGTAFGPGGCLYACDNLLGAILKFEPDGSCSRVSSGFNGKRYHHPNDLAFSIDGDLYFTDPDHYDRNHPDGQLYRLSIKTGEVQIALDSLAFPNGLCFSKDGRYLYFGQSALEAVYRTEILDAGEKGMHFSHPELFVRLPGGDPDGMALDLAGNLYVAHFGGSSVYVIDPEGKIKERISIPGKKPSNLEFGGKDMRSLYVTEGQTGSIFRIDCQIPGLRLFKGEKNRN